MRPLRLPLRLSMSWTQAFGYSWHALTQTYPSCEAADEAVQLLPLSWATETDYLLPDPAQWLWISVDSRR